MASTPEHLESDCNFLDIDNPLGDESLHDRALSFSQWIRTHSTESEAFSDIEYHVQISELDHQEVNNPRFLCGMKRPWVQYYTAHSHYPEERVRRRVSTFVTAATENQCKHAINLESWIRSPRCQVVIVPDVVSMSRTKEDIPSRNLRYPEHDDFEVAPPCVKTFLSLKEPVNLTNSGVGSLRTIGTAVVVCASYRKIFRVVEYVIL